MKGFIGIVEIAVIVSMILTAITQVIVPFFKGTPMFPIFHRKRRKLERKLESMREQLTEAELVSQISEHQARLEDLRRREQCSKLHVVNSDRNGE